MKPPTARHRAEGRPAFPASIEAAANVFGGLRRGGVTGRRIEATALVTACALTLASGTAQAGWNEGAAGSVSVAATVWSAPTVKLAAVTNQRADASWALGSDAVRYNAEQRINAGPWTPLATGTSALSASIAAAGGSTVDVRVTGTAGSSTGPSGQASVVLPIYAPTGLTLGFASPTIARAVWNASSGATRYRLEYSLDGGPWQLGRYDENGWYEWTVHSGQKVSVRVRADNGSVYSDWSAAVTQQSPFTSVHTPVGALDSAVRSGGAITMTGWALDQDGTVPVGVHVYVVPGTDSSNIIQRGTGYRFTADQPRADVAAAFPGMGASHGYSITVPAPSVPSTACAFVIDHTGGNNPQLFCRSL
jgi:hypothetical protein